MPGITIYHRNSRRFAVWRARLHDEIACDPGDPNPMLWFCEELLKDTETEELYNDMIVAGVRTKRECLAAIEEEMDRSI